MVEIFRIKCGMSNCYILKEGSIFILVDAGSKGSGKKIIESMRKLNIKPEDLSLIVLTHGHAGHSGGAEFFRENYGIKIAMSPEDKNIARPMAGRGVIGKVIAALSKNSNRLSISPDIELAENNRLDKYGVHATILELQGHTKGSIGILLEDRRLVSGDTLMNFFMPSFARVAQDFVLLDKSCIRLKMLGIGMVYPGHGKPFSFKKL